MMESILVETCPGCQAHFRDVHGKGLCPTCARGLENIASTLAAFVSELVRVVVRSEHEYVM